MIESRVNCRAGRAPAGRPGPTAEIYPEVIKAAKIDPVDYPNVEIVQLEKGKPFIFKLAVEVNPEVKLGKYKGIKVTKKAVELKEEEAPDGPGAAAGAFCSDERRREERVAAAR